MLFHHVTTFDLAKKPVMHNNFPLCVTTRYPLKVCVMSNFLVLATFSNRQIANRTCEILEDAGIPILLEHVEYVDCDEREFGYRLLVPSDSTQNAMEYIAPILKRHDLEDDDMIVM